MKQYKGILALVVLCGAVVYGSQVAAPTLLRDGFALNEAQGSLKYSDSKGCWFFELDTDTKDDRGVVKAGTSLQLLPSSTLEGFVADFESSNKAQYKLSGRITKYKGSNYIFPSYFQAIISARTQGNTEIQDTKITPDSNDPLALPPDILEQFRKIETNTAYTGQRTDSNRPSAVQPSPAAESRKAVSVDFMLVNKTAFLVQKDGGFEFELDSLGQNLSNISYKLLPCELLEKSESTQAAAYERIRFNITGIVTRYKGSNYLLLIKASRFYGNGNFNG
jgi:hypothetical protein